MISAMPGEERHPPVLDLGNCNRVRRFPVRRVDTMFLGVGEQGIQARTTDDGKVSDDGHVQTLTGSGLAGYGAVMAFSVRLDTGRRPPTGGRS